MATRAKARPVFDAPLHLRVAENGAITLYLPDGHRLDLTPDAAERSASILTRARRKPSGTGKVIKADFGQGRARALCKTPEATYMAADHGPTDSRHLRQKENRR